jgi:sorting nexin-7/30
VNRTYSDFEWLYTELFDIFPGVIIPSLPQRTVLAKLNILSLTGTIRAQRHMGLEEFLRKVLSHSKLKNLEIVDKFFTQNDQDFRRLASEY